MKKKYNSPELNTIGLDNDISLVLMSGPGGPPDWVCEKYPCLRACGGSGCHGHGPSENNNPFSDNPFSNDMWS
jgi:hypothetical protein